MFLTSDKIGRKTNCTFNASLPTEWAWQVNKGLLLPAFVQGFFLVLIKHALKGSELLNNSMNLMCPVVSLTCLFIGILLVHGKGPAKARKFVPTSLAVMLNASLCLNGVWNETDRFNRVGLLYYHHVVWKLFPSFVCCPKQHIIFIIGIGYVIDLIALALNQQLHGDPVPISAVVWFAFSSLSGIRLGLFNQARFRKLYQTQELVKSKSAACETLISMLCDGLVWVADDGETVVKKERLCDLTGYANFEKLRDLLASDCDELRGSDEVHRLHDAIQRSKKGPVLFHTICPCREKEFCSVDFFIVRQEAIFSGNEECNPECRHGFLVGLRLHSQFACHPIGRPLGSIADADEFGAEPMMESQPSEVRINIKHGDENCGDMQSPMSTGTSSGFQPQSPMSMTTSLVFQPLRDIEDMAQSMVHLEKLGCKEHWLIRPQHLQVCPEEVLGRGAFGVVIAGFLHGTRVAVKMPKSTTVTHAMNSLVNEIRILRRCRHPNLVLFHGVSIAENKSQLALVFDKVPGTTLRYFIREPPCGPNALERHRLVLDICEALRYLHGQDPQVFHGDIKPENIMVDDVTHARPCAKMLDFGLSRLVTGSANQMGGTLHWMAPEIITGSRPHTSADVFSFGHLVNFIMSGHHPYPGKTATEIRQMACRGETCITVPSGACYEEACKDLCEQCCAFEAAERLSMASAHRRILTWATPNAKVSINSACAPHEATGREDLKNDSMMQQHIMEL